MATDKLGSELARGDKVTLAGEVTAISEDGKIVVKVEVEDGSPPLVQVKSANVTKAGDSDMTKAARRGFNSAFDPKADEQSK